MLLSLPVVQQGLFPHALLQKLSCHRNGTVRGDLPVQHRRLQCIQRHAGIPIGKGCHDGKQLRLHVNRGAPESPPVLQHAGKQLLQVLRTQLLQDKYPAAGQKRRIDFKGRILRGGPDEDNAALFHIGKEGVLLGFVKAMDLIHEYHRAHTAEPAFLSLLHDLLYLSDAAGHRAEIHEFGFGAAGNDSRQRRLPHSRRPPEDHGGDHIPLQHLAQDLPFSQQMLLPDILLQILRAHPVCQGRHSCAGHLVRLYVK